MQIWRVTCAEGQKGSNDGSSHRAPYWCSFNTAGAADDDEEEAICELYFIKI
jgi:hypothetical protein